jgi:hypothetical protein
VSGIPLESLPARTRRVTRKVTLRDTGRNHLVTSTDGEPDVTPVSSWPARIIRIVRTIRTMKVAPTRSQAIPESRAARAGQLIAISYWIFLTEDRSMKRMTCVPCVWSSSDL